MDKLARNEALSLIYSTRNLSDAALLAWHMPNDAYFSQDLADQFERVFEIMQEINGARLYRRGLAEKKALAGD